MRHFFGLLIVFLCVTTNLTRAAEQRRETVNSIGMTLVRIEPGQPR
jgi:hypothetical protein